MQRAMSENLLIFCFRNPTLAEGQTLLKMALCSRWKMWEELNQLSSYGVCFSTLSTSVLDIDKVWGEISSTFEPSFSSSDVLETFDLDGAQMNVQSEGEIH